MKPEKVRKRKVKSEKGANLIKKDSEVRKSFINNQFHAKMI